MRVSFFITLLRIKERAGIIIISMLLSCQHCTCVFNYKLQARNWMPINRATWPLGHVKIALIIIAKNKTTCEKPTTKKL